MEKSTERRARLLRQARNITKPFIPIELLADLRDLKSDFRNDVIAKLVVRQFVRQIKSPRNRAIIINRARGFTYAELGEKYNITKQRVEQIIRREGQVFKEPIKSAIIKRNGQKPLSD